MYPNAKMFHDFVNSSGHNFIILCLIKSGKRMRSDSQRDFKFEPMWLREKTFRQTVEVFWRKASQEGRNFLNKLKSREKKLTILRILKM